jgi:hypothetical protein
MKEPRRASRAARALGASSLLAAVVGGEAAWAQDFAYNPPGVLVSGSGRGRADETVYVPGMRYPIEESPSFANSQVWGVGGSQGPSGSQCDARNFSYPWSDNYCESRQWDMPLCPSGTGHQGQDIRAATCEDARWWAVAAEDGSITNIGSYSVTLMGASGTKHRYLHMDAGTLAVRVGQQVRRGDRMGKVSNEFGGTPTSIHLHYDLFQTIQGVGGVYVPPYLSLVESYEELVGQEAVPCAELPPDGGTLDNAGPCARFYGPPATWREVTGQGNEGSLRWTYAWTNETPGNWARFSLYLVEGGEYEVAVNVIPEFATSQQTPYKVRAGGQERDVRVNLTTDAQGGWLVLGRFAFAAGGDQWVDVYDNSGETSAQQRRVMADALRLTRVRPQPDPEPEPDLPEEPEEDAAQDTGAPDLPDDNNNADNNGPNNNGVNNGQDNNADNNADNNDLNSANNDGANNADDGRDNNSSPNNANANNNSGEGDNSGDNGGDDNSAGGAGAPKRFEESCASLPGAGRGPSGLWLAALALGWVLRRARR